MGAVVQWSDVVAKYRDAGSSGDSNTMDASYILPAEAYISGRLLRVFSSPLTDAGAIVKDLIIDETYKRLCLAKAPKKADALAKDISERLSDIVNGKVILINNSGLEVNADRYVTWSNTADYTPTFGVGDILDMEVDPDQISDEEDARG